MSAAIKAKLAMSQFRMKSRHIRSQVDTRQVARGR
jgi:hypothetical protein